jgi:predicted nucleic acid-binding protein
VQAPAALYMVDTCSFTELRRTYPRPHLDAVWRLVERVADDGRLLSVEEVFNELQAQDDEVAQWAMARRSLFLPLTEDIQQKAREILISHRTLVNIRRKKSGADPFLIAAAIVHNAIVVTQEKKSGGPPAVKIPDVCEAYGVRCIPLLTLLQQEGLAT